MRGIFKQKQGQTSLTIGDAPGVVLIVLFLFMVLGTAAFVLEEYRGSMGATSDTVTNETVTVAERIANATVATSTLCNFGSFAVTTVLESNSSAGVITSGNYTTNTGTGVITNLTSYGEDISWLVSYTHVRGGVGCNVTEALTIEVSDSTPIAGMVLIISLIGIVLSILIGLFYVFTRRRGL